MATTGAAATQRPNDADCIERDEKLPEYALNYYDSLRAKFETLFFERAFSEAEQKAYAEAKKVVDKACAGKPLTWADLMRLDLALVRLLTLDQLRLRIAELQSRLAGVTPALPENVVPKVDPTTSQPIDSLRAAAELLVTRIWQLRMARNARDRYVGELRRYLYWWLLGLILLFTGISFAIVLHQERKAASEAATAEKKQTKKDAAATEVKKDSAAKQAKKDAEPKAATKAAAPADDAKAADGPDIGRVPLFFVIMIAGMLGALISILRRLQAALTAPPSSDLGSELSALAYERRMTLISLFSGAVFAILLYVVFVAGLSEMVGGTLTPKFSVPKTHPPEGTDFLIFVTKVGPSAPADYARVVLWSFIAGFSEQFVPDVLDRIVKKK